MGRLLVSPFLIYSGVAQLVVATDSYPVCRKFDSCHRYHYGDVMVSTGTNEHSRNKSQVCVKSKPKKINGNIFSKIANRVKSVFTANAVALA